MSEETKQIANNKRLLLVDDDKNLLKACHFYLSAKGYDVHTCDSGEAGLETLQSESFPVIVSDMHMDSMNGIEFIVKARDFAADSIYMLLTASRETQTAVSAINDANVFCVINKPVSMADLQGFVDAAYLEYEKHA